MSNDLQHTALNGTADYIAALDTLCGLAQRSLYVFEKDYAEAGFNAVARHDILRRFLLASPANRLHLLTHDTRSATQYCPRLTLLLRQFSHNMHIYQTPKHLLHLSEPFAVADEAHYVRRFHFDDPGGLFAQHDPENSRALKAQFEEIWAASRPGVTATTLGL